MSRDKIPEIIELGSFFGNYDKYEEAIYAAYRASFETQNFYWEGKAIRHKKYPLYKDKPATFWHIISDGSREEERIPNLRRYERISWPAYILGYCKTHCDQILTWKNKRKGKTRIVLWCQDIDYIVILDEREEFCIFWTAYPVVYHHTRQKLLKEYNDYVANRAS